MRKQLQTRHNLNSLERRGPERERVRTTVGPPFQDGTKAEGVVLYIRKETAAALQAIRPAEDLQDRNSPVFGLSPRQSVVE